MLREVEEELRQVEEEMRVMGVVRQEFGGNTKAGGCMDDHFM